MGNNTVPPLIKISIEEEQVLMQQKRKMHKPRISISPAHQSEHCSEDGGAKMPKGAGSHVGHAPQHRLLDSSVNGKFRKVIDGRRLFSCRWVG